MQTPRPDAAPFIRPDAMPPAPDAMPTCADSNEDNDTSATATSLSAAPVSDDDGAGGSFTGAALGAALGADEDWFTYEGSDDAFNEVDPTVGLTSGAVEVCMFMDCKVGATQYSCPAGTTEQTADGLSGCCSTSGFAVVDNVNCTGVLSDDMNIYFRIKATAAGVCESYSLTYHY